jgi:hypothetical protein
MAYAWGLRHSPMPVVLIGELPEHIFQELEASRLIITQPVPGAKAEYQVPLETVFYPASYPTVNRYVHWQIIDPYGARGEASSA